MEEGEEILWKVAYMIQRAEETGASEEGTLAQGTLPLGPYRHSGPGELLRGTDCEHISRECVHASDYCAFALPCLSERRIRVQTHLPEAGFTLLSLQM